MKKGILNLDKSNKDANYKMKLSTKEVISHLVDIESKIPADASAQNQLATKEDVATSSATYRGSFNLVSDLGLTTSATESQVAAALADAVSTADNNDYVNVQVPSSDSTPARIARADRYKFNGSAWAFEYSGPGSDAEVTSNKVTSLSSESTDTEYPSAKCVYDMVGNVESLLAEI